MGKLPAGTKLLTVEAHGQQWTVFLGRGYTFPAAVTVTDPKGQQRAKFRDLETLLAHYCCALEEIDRLRAAEKAGEIQELLDMTEERTMLQAICDMGPKGAVWYLVDPMRPRRHSVLCRGKSHAVLRRAIQRLADKTGRGYTFRWENDGSVETIEPQTKPKEPHG